MKKNERGETGTEGDRRRRGKEGKGMFKYEIPKWTWVFCNSLGMRSERAFQFAGTHGKGQKVANRLP